MRKLEELKIERNMLDIEINKLERTTTWVRNLKSICITGHPVDPDNLDGFIFGMEPNVERLKAAVLDCLEKM